MPRIYNRSQEGKEQRIYLRVTATFKKNFQAKCKELNLSSGDMVEKLFKDIFKGKE